MAKEFLVTGGAGFIGSNLVDKLLAEASDAKVIVVDNFNDFYDPQIKRENIKDHLQNPAYKLYEGDLCDYQFLEQVFAENNISHVVHLAASAGVRPSLENPVFYQKNNNESTMNLLDIMTKLDSSKAKIEKFIFGSSSSVYGSRSQVPFREDEDITKPISPYAATKVSGEAICYTMSHLYKLPTLCLRFFTVYGPRQRSDLAIHKFTKLIDEGKSIPVFGDGTAQRDFTYIDDILDGIMKSLDYDFTKSENDCFDIFNLGESQTSSVSMLISLIEDRLGKKAKIEYFPVQPGDVPITYADISKSKERLGYNPQVTMSSGITRFVNWFLDTKAALV